MGQGVPSMECGERVEDSVLEAGAEVLMATAPAGDRGGGMEDVVKFFEGIVTPEDMVPSINELGPSGNPVQGFGLSAPGPATPIEGGTPRQTAYSDKAKGYRVKGPFSRLRDWVKRDFSNSPPRAKRSPGDRDGGGGGGVDVLPPRGRRGLRFGGQKKGRKGK
ncbi:unnamed protein product [Discosporangium mesarthrocarpum]